MVKLEEMAGIMVNQQAQGESKEEETNAGRKKEEGKKDARGEEKKMYHYLLMLTFELDFVHSAFPSLQLTHTALPKSQFLSKGAMLFGKMSVALSSNEWTEQWNKLSAFIAGVLRRNHWFFLKWL